MPRVLWLIKGLGPGGAETLLTVAGQVHDHDEFHIECAYVVPFKDHLTEQLERSGVRCHCLSATRNDFRWPLRLRQLLTEGRFDVVHAHSPLPASAARIAARTMRAKNRPSLVRTEHNGWATFSGATRRLNRITSSLDDAVYAVSEETRLSMSTTEAARCTTLRHGIDIERVAALSYRREAMRAELGIGNGEFVIGTVANLRAQKDYPNLLRAASALQRRGLHARVVAVGQGPLEHEITGLRDDLGLRQSVVLTGYRSDAVDVMTTFDIFTLASKHEGLPVALMQALALALPVVTTRVGGVSEVLTDEDAILVPAEDPEALADGWEQLMTTPGLAARLGARSASLAGRFDAAPAIAEYEACYRQLTPTKATGVRADDTTAANGPRRALASGAQFRLRPATANDRPAILALCRDALGWGDDPRFAQLFAWKHDDNPFGSSYMWVATEREQVVALRAFMRWEFVRDGQVVRAVRAVDTATHSEYRGNGLFTDLTMFGLDHVRADGVEFVFNTPNQQSCPGYLKMGWNIVGRLPAAIRCRTIRSAATTATSRVAASLWPLPLRVGQPVDEILASRDVASAVTQDPRVITTNRSNAFLSWRYGAEFLGYRAVESDHGIVLVRRRWRGGADELVLLDALDVDRRAADRLAASLLREVGATHLLRLGPSDLSAGLFPAPGAGPVLTWRSAASCAMPPISNWQLTMGDIELF